MMPRPRAPGPAALPLRFSVLAAALLLAVVAGGLLGRPTPASATTLAVSAIAIQSDAGTDTQYHAGEDIVIRVTFGTETITAHSSATITIDVGGENRTATVADVASGGTTTYVDFTYVVADNDRDADGISVAAGALGGSYTHTDPHTSVAFTQTVAPSASHRVNVNTTNYDTDGDGLIEIDTLAQLNAIRWDTGGDGQPTDANAADYAAAFPARAASHGCPDTADADSDPGPCIGYELTASLDFDRDGDDTADAPYANWSSLPTWNTRFNGNGHTISNLNISSAGAGDAGLFARLGGSGRIYAVGLLNPTVRNAGGVNGGIGALVGRNAGGNIYAAYARGGSVNSTANDARTGGLVGWNSGTITASYSTVTVSGGNGNWSSVGGLVGLNHPGSTWSAGTINYSYAAGSVSGRTGSGVAARTGCLSGYGPTGSHQHGNDAGSYYLPVGCPSNGAGASQTAAALTGPTEYTGIYADWNRNLDGVAGLDDPWNFGTASQYPVLHYGRDTLLTAQGREPTTDYDTDNDGLIDIKTLAQLNAIRHDLDGNGHSILPAYGAAFPNRNTPAAGRMGCPNGACTGYELLNNLDFDSNEDGAVDADDTYPSWDPIGDVDGPYTANFNGNGHTIARLTVSETGQFPAGNVYMGLFGYIFDGPVIENVALTDVSITDARSHAASAFYYAGALAGFVAGTVRTSYATGTLTVSTGDQTSSRVGGLVGLLRFPEAGVPGRLDASWAAVNTTVNSTSAHSANDAVGGMVGELTAPSAITASYSAGSVAVSNPSRAAVGGLVGRLENANATAAGSYWDTKTSGIADDADKDPPEGKSTENLQAPTGYRGIYQSWDDHDRNGDGSPDAPWDFGDRCQYPVLDWGGHDLEAQRAGDDPCPPEPAEYVAPPIVYNLNIRFSVRSLTLDEGESGSYRVRMTQAPSGHPARVSVESNNSDVVVSPTELVFSAANYDRWQTVTVTVLRDANELDESAHIAHRGPRLSYGGFIVNVNDTWPGTTTETVNGYTITVKDTVDAPLGVTVTAPATLDRDTEVTVSGAPADTPQSASGYGLGATAAARLSVSIGASATPADGLNICLPLPAALVAEAAGRPLTLLRYAGDDGGWSAVAGAQRRGDALCADGVTEYGVFAAAYVIPDALGAPANLAATPGAAPGSVVLTWTPAAYAARHFVFGIKQSDAVAGDTSNLAAWTFAERPNVHTVTGLESGAAYYFTVTAGRSDADGNNEWSPWAPWAVIALD